MKQLSLKQSTSCKGVPKEVNEKNEPVKTVSQATVDLGHVVEAIKKIEEEAKGFLMKSRLKVLKNEKQC